MMKAYEESSATEVQGLKQQLLSRSRAHGLLQKELSENRTAAQNERRDLELCLGRQEAALEELFRKLLLVVYCLKFAQAT